MRKLTTVQAQVLRVHEHRTRNLLDALKAEPPRSPKAQKLLDDVACSNSLLADVLDELQTQSEVLS